MKILEVILLNDGLTIQEIAKETNFDYSHINKIVNKSLVFDKFVKRIAFKYYITSFGKKLFLIGRDYSKFDKYVEHWKYYYERMFIELISEMIKEGALQVKKRCLIDGAC